MTSYKAIVAMTKDRVIGKYNQIPWTHKGDLKRFKELTKGHMIVMGNNTFQSIGKPLPERTNIILTRNKSQYSRADVIYATSLQEVLDLTSEKDTVWICGGAEIYQMFMPHLSEIDVTSVPDEIDPDGCTIFPELYSSVWSATLPQEHTYNKVLTITTYTRKKQ